MELMIATRSCVDPEGRPRSFHYYLTVDQIETPGFCCENYGVRIDELMTLLTDHLVGPAGLADVVADWL